MNVFNYFIINLFENFVYNVVCVIKFFFVIVFCFGWVKYIIIDEVFVVVVVCFDGLVEWSILNVFVFCFVFGLNKVVNIEKLIEVRYINDNF